MRSTKHNVLIFIVAAMSLAACQTVQPTQQGQATNAVPSTQAPNLQTGSLCDNPYFPVVEGASWNYSLTTGSGTVTTVQTITDVGTDGFLLQTDSPNISYVVTFKCSLEGLYWLESTGGMFAAVFQSDAGTATVETNSYSGDFFVRRP